MGFGGEAILRTLGSRLKFNALILEDVRSGLRNSGTVPSILNLIGEKNLVI